MRKIWLAALAASLLVPVVSEAQQRSQHDRWCRNQGLGRGDVMICSAFTYEQCMASRTNHTESCFLNPIYDPRNAEWRKRNPNY